MDFRIVIQDGGGGSTGQQQQTGGGGGGSNPAQQPAPAGGAPLPPAASSAPPAPSAGQSIASQARDDAARTYVENERKKEYRGEYAKVFDQLHTAADEAKEQAEQMADSHRRRMAVQKELFAADTAEMAARRNQEEEALTRARRLEVAKESFGLESAAAAAEKGLEEEAIWRGRRLEVMKERYRQDTAAMEAARLQEEDATLRQRMLDVTRERHRIEGSAAEEARLQLEGQKEAKEWQKKVNEERRKQDPGAAMGEDLGALGGLVGQATGGKGIGGMVGRLLQMAPQLQEMTGLFGKSEAQKRAEEGHAASSGQPVGGGGGGGKRKGALDHAAELAKMGGEGSGLGAGGSNVPQFSNAMGGAEMAGVEGAAGGAAGAAGGAMGGLAAAAGPIGLMLVAAQQYKQMKDDMVKGVTDGIQSAGKGAANLVGGKDNFGTAMGAAEGMTKLAEKVPIVGEYLGYFGKGAMAAAQAVNMVQDSFLQLGQQLKPFSAAINEAEANVTVRKLQGDMKEADELGPTIARLMESQANTGEMLRELFLPVKKFLGEGVTTLMEVVEGFVEWIQETVEGWTWIQAMEENIEWFFTGIREFFKKMLGRDLGGRRDRGEETLEDAIGAALADIRAGRRARRTSVDPGSGRVEGGPMGGGF